MIDNKKRVLYLSYDGLTDPLGQSQILPYVEGLSELGFCFHLISFEKEEKYKRLGDLIKKRCAESGIQWIPMRYTKRPPILSTMFDIARMKKKAFNLQSELRFQIVHCRSYIPSLVALSLKRKYQIPFVFDMRGFWADERVDGKIWNLNSPLQRSVYNFFKRKERHFINRSDAIVSLTKAGKKEIERWLVEDPRYGGSEDYYNYDKVVSFNNKTFVIPCSTDLKLFDFHRISENKKKWLCAVHGIDPSLEYLGYVGSVGTWYLGREMLEMYAFLLNSKPELRFLFLSQDDLTELRNYAADIGIPQSYIIQISARRSEVPSVISLMTVSVFFILPAFSKLASSPTKQGELMAMGIPVICNDNVGDTAEVVEKYNAGIVLSNFNNLEYQSIVDHWDELISRSPDSIRFGAKTYFSLSKGVNQYFNVYNRVLDNNN